MALDNLDPGRNLKRNKLESLPDEFGDIEVGGKCDLTLNSLQTLPSSFTERSVGGET